MVITTDFASMCKNEYLYERQHFVLHNCWGVIFGGDDFDQHTIHEVPVGHLDMKPVATVFYTGFQNLQRGEGMKMGFMWWLSFGMKPVPHLLTVSASITSL